jgi:hypothetical protein
VEEPQEERLTSRRKVCKHREKSMHKLLYCEEYSCSNGYFNLCIESIFMTVP